MIWRRRCPRRPNFIGAQLSLSIQTCYRARQPSSLQRSESSHPRGHAVPARRSNYFPPLLCTAAFILPAAAVAAESTDTRGASADSILGEVVVTAEKRTETIRAVAQSVSVL